jgi:hypothetical protein
LKTSVAGAGDDPKQLAGWLRCVRASVSQRALWAVFVAGLAAALAIGAWLALTQRSARELWVFETLLDFLRTTPPTDVILAQLPPERMASVRVRGLALVGRLLTPALCAAAFGALGITGAYVLLARRMRPVLVSVVVPRSAAGLLNSPSRGTFAVIAVLAIAVHLPHALQSIRYDEDQAAVYASSSWFAWANNLTGWQNHVAALLTIRLFTAVFGISELSVRMPAILASSFSLALLCAHLERRFSATLGWCTGALFLAMPLWAEQTSLARGYGLTFSAAVLMLVGLLRLHDERDRASTTTMGCLFASVFIGCLAHFFFVFMAAGLFALMFFTRQLSSSVRAAALWWLALAAVVPMFSIALGLPGTLAILQQTTPIEPSVIIRRFTDEFAFRHTGAVGTALALITIATLLASAAVLPRVARWPYFGLLFAAFFGPLAGNPVFVYPRYFLHTLALIVPCCAWFVSMRLLRERRLPNLILLGALAGLYVSTRPWYCPEQVDMRGASALARSEAHAHGSQFAIDTFIASGVRFYNGSPGRIVNTLYPIPRDVNRVLLAIDAAHERSRIQPGFQIERRLPGIEHDVLLLHRTEDLAP